MMTSTKTLQRYLEKSIDDLIQTLERRIKVNTSTKMPSFSDNKSLLYANQERISDLKSICFHYEYLEEITMECNDVIHKLLLIRAMINTRDINLLIHCFTHYSDYSCDEIFHILKTKENPSSNAIKKDFLMVA